MPLIYTTIDQMEPTITQVKTTFLSRLPELTESKREY